MTKDELIGSIAEKTGIENREVAQIIDAFTAKIKEKLKQGEKVVIPGFGSFVLSLRHEKTYPHPKTGQMQTLPERVLPHFKAGGDLQRNLKT